MIRALMRCSLSVFSGSFSASSKAFLALLSLAAVNVFLSSGSSGGGVGGGGGFVCNSNSAIVIAIKSASSGASVGQSSPSALTILWSPSFPTATILYIGGVSSRGTDSK